MKFGSLILAGTAAALFLMSSLPSACGAAVEKRDASQDAVKILHEAASQIHPLGAHLAQALKKGDLTDRTYVTDNVKPIVAQIGDVVATAANKITTLQPSTGVEKRQVNTAAVAAALATLVRAVVVALQPLLNFLQSISLIQELLGGFLSTIGANLNTIAIGLGLVVAGVLQLVRDLLSSLTGALSGLGFTGLLGTLGL